jgi:hypothetical protein
MYKQYVKNAWAIRKVHAKIKSHRPIKIDKQTSKAQFNQTNPRRGVTIMLWRAQRRMVGVTLGIEGVNNENLSLNIFISDILLNKLNDPIYMRKK